MTGIVAAIAPVKTFLVYELLLVAGGGGATTNTGQDGSGCAGGGAGGVRYFSGQKTSAPPFTVTLGAGGTGGFNTACTKGNASVFGSLSSSGGGNGRREGSSNPDGIGGSGGGIFRSGGWVGPTPALQNAGNSGGYSPVEGYPGSGIPAAPTDAGRVLIGAGGGAGGAIPDETTTGGNGAQYSITGTSTYYGGGGGSGRSVNPSYPTIAGGPGGLGGGGSGGLTAGAAGSPGTANTGGGGGGGGGVNGGGSTSGNGGSGVIIVAYPSGSIDLQVGPGLTYTTDTTSRPGKKIITFTAGTGTCNWA